MNRIEYDAIIVGAGISGLICGSYLSKAGLKVLIIEKQNKVGGYCSSFKRQGFDFDIGVHYLAGVRKGILGQILRELELTRTLQFSQLDPTDRIITQDSEILIHKDIEDTVAGFCKNYKDDNKRIQKLFDFILKTDLFNLYLKTNRKSFADILSSFGLQKSSSAVINTFIEGNTGSTSDKITALGAAVLFREYLKDPGYYPKKGIQQLPETLADVIKAHRGDLLLNATVTRIHVTAPIKQVVLKDGRTFRAKTVISNVDACLTFRKLINLPLKEILILKHLMPTPSSFSIYLGVKDKTGLYDNCRVWYCLKQKKPFSFLGINFAKNHTAHLFILSPYLNKSYWKKNKQKTQELVLKIATDCLPALPRAITVKVSASPSTFNAYTNNFHGALYGWAHELGKEKYFLPQVFSVPGLYGTGHWYSKFSSGPGGIPQVSFLGRNLAKIILQKANKKWDYPEYRL